MSGSYDVTVIGIGGMGSAAVFHLARRGARVLGLERFDIPHAMGSSHGVNRIIRRTYYEHSDYVPLLGRAYELWRDLERTVGPRELHVTGAEEGDLYGFPEFGIPGFKLGRHHHLGEGTTADGRLRDLAA